MRLAQTFILLLCCSALNAQADMVVVVSAKAPVSSLTREQIADIFLGRTKSFPDGNAVIPIEQPGNSQTNQIFHQQITGKSPIQLRAYWSKMVFSGQSVPPREIPSDELLRILKNTPNAIGYLDRSEIDASVKILYSY